MGERKVLNKYYPPDFDPEVLPKMKRPKNEQYKIRFMLPMTVQCNTCGEYIGRGKKFNARKEDVVGVKYLGLQIFRFYFRCPMCSAEITIKTDLEHADYECEFGAKRMFEPWKEAREEEEKAVKQRDEEEDGDAMKALENRTMESKREMELLDALDDIKDRNARAAGVAIDGLVDKLYADKDNSSELLRLQQEKEDENIAKAAFSNKQKIKRLSEENEDADTGQTSSTSLFGNLKPLRKSDKAVSNFSTSSSKLNSNTNNRKRKVVVVKRKT